MEISELFKERLLSEFGSPARGKNWREVVIIDTGNSPPTNRDTAGYTEWKNGRAKRYHRATYTLEISSGWIRENYPVSVVTAAVVGGPVQEDYRDTYTPATDVSLDAEEDERLYA